MSISFKTPTRYGVLRSVRTVVASLGMMLIAAPAAAAQTSVPDSPSPELRFTSGAFVPTGNQRNFLKDAQSSAVQLSVLVRPSLAVTGTFGWARSRDITSEDADKLDVFTSDLGLETRWARGQAHGSVTFSPFIGIGAGLRSYNYRKLDLNATHNAAGYAAAGGEFRVSRVAVRLEARNYTSGFKPLSGARKSQMRNDVSIMLGLRFNRQQPQK